MSADLAGRTAVVTGASSGIGRAIAERLAEAKVHVFLVGRNEAALSAVRERIASKGGVASVAVLDVRDNAALVRSIDRAVEMTGTLDIMVNSAGVEYPTSLLDGNVEQWREQFETNVLALLTGAQAAVRAMRAGGFSGHIVNIGSIAGRFEEFGVYGATKSAVNMIGASLRRELERDRIRVVQILPGAVFTNLGRNLPPRLVMDTLQSLGEDVPFRAGDLLPDDVIDRAQKAAKWTFASADDVARAVLFAVSQPIELDIFEIVIRPASDRR